MSSYPFHYQLVPNQEGDLEQPTNMNQQNDNNKSNDTNDIASSPTLSPSLSAYTTSPLLPPHSDTSSLDSSSSARLNVDINSNKVKINDPPPEQLKISISSKEKGTSDINNKSKPVTSPSLSKFRRFVRFYGIPLGSDTSAVDTVVLHTTNVSTPKPSLPNLSPTSAAQYLVDAIDAENEDPFTLEPFEDLMKVCADQGKDFIFARVTTMDPSDESKFYFSYYAAHHINKVLFRTQPEEGLLHRMKAKNPLNNMTIIGDVHYYSITPEAFYSARGVTSTMKENHPSPTSASYRNSKLLKKKNKRKSVAEKVLSSLSMMNKKDQQRVLLVMTGSPLESEKVNDAPERVRRPSADDVFHFVSKSSTTKNRQSFLDLASLGIHAHSINNTDPFSTTPKQPHRKLSFSSSDTKKPQLSPLPPTLLSAEDRITPRDISFHNEKLHSKYHSMSVEDWIRLQCDDTFLSIFSPTPSSPQDTPSEHTDTASGLRRRMSKGSVSEIVAASSPQPVIYEARFHSTDDDFLMKSSVRAYFKKNAADTTDSLLFSIPASTTILFSDDTTLEPHPALPGFHFSVEEGHRGGFLRRFFQQRSAMRYVMLLYIIVGSLIIRFVVPENLVYLFSFLLIFLLFVAFIFVAENDANQQ